MKKIPAGELYALPRRRSGQTLQGFIRTHLKYFDRALAEGVRYEALAKALRASGFGERTVVSLRVAVYRARKGALECVSTQAPQNLNPVAVQMTQPVEELLPPQVPRNPVVQKMLTGPAEDVDATKAIGREFRRLISTPRPGSSEPDPLI